MPKTCMTDVEVEAEIERLRKDPNVALARREERIRYQRRQILYQLRSYERKGKALAAAGITMEILDEMGMEGYDDA